MKGGLLAQRWLTSALRFVNLTPTSGKTLPQLRKKGSLSNPSDHGSRKFAAISLVFVAAITCLGAQGALAQDMMESKVLRVAVKPIPPFVFKHGTDLSGFSIDLWNSVAQSLKVDTKWVEVTTVGDQLQALKNGTADAAIAAITITKERENVVDFTQPYFDSGLQIMVHA